MQRLCPRCRYAISFEDDGGLCFCPHCGAPQVRLSEELSAEMEQQRDAAAVGDAASAPAAATADTGAINWRGALRCAALAGAIAGALALLSIPLPGIFLLALFWALTAPVVTLGIYAARFRVSRIRPGFGARFGLLCGLAVLAAMATVNTSSILVQRFVLHHTVEFDTLMAHQIAQLQTTVAQQAGNPASAPLAGALHDAEFRAGLWLSSLAMMSVLYLVFSMAGGSFAGMLRAGKPAAPQA